MPDGKKSPGPFMTAQGPFIPLFSFFAPDSEILEEPAALCAIWVPAGLFQAVFRKMLNKPEELGTAGLVPEL